MSLEISQFCVVHDVSSNFPYVGVKAICFGPCQCDCCTTSYKVGFVVGMFVVAIIFAWARRALAFLLKKKAVNRPRRWMV